VKVVRAKPQQEDTQRLMRRLAGSLVSWLTFEQAARRSKIMKEQQMYTPIYEVAVSRGWKISTQVPLKGVSREDKEKSTKYIDFVFYTRNRVAAVELSHVRTVGRSPSPTDKILVDQCKLQKFKKDDFREGRHGSPRRYVMIASKENQLKKNTVDRTRDKPS
jgi:hypothetical protein